MPARRPLSRNRLATRLGTLPGDGGGTTLVMTVMMMGMVLSVAAFTFDIHRATALNTELQNAADAAALAGAKELNRLPGAIGRATAAATGATTATLTQAVTNDQRFGGFGEVAITGVRFFETLGGPELDPGAAASEKLAAFIEVTTETGTVASRFLQFAGGPNTLTTVASATAGSQLIACQVTPLWMCNPELSGARFSASHPKVGQQFIMRDKGNGNWQQPGNFGLLNNPATDNGNSGAKAVMELLASPNPPICYVSELTPRTGGVAGPVKDGINVRFDIYPNGWKTAEVLANYPARRPVRGIQPRRTNNACQLENNPDYAQATHSLPMPRDLCFQGVDGNAAVPAQCDSALATLRNGAAMAGNGSWQGNGRAQAYFQHNYGVNAPAAVAGMTRYQLWQWEQTPGFLTAIGAARESPDLAAGSCYQQTTGTAVPADLERRIIYVAIVDCAANPFNGGSGGSMHSTQYAKFFVTESVQDADGSVYGEYLGLVEVNDGSGVLHEIIQLYR